MSVTLRTIPRTVLIIAVLFFLVPVISYVFTGLGRRVPLTNVPVILATFGPLNYVLFLMAWLIGAGLLHAKKWGYYLFFAFMGILMLFNLMVIIGFLAPESFMAIQVKGVRVTLRAVLVNSALIMIITAGIFYFLHREVSAPYMSVISRGWRTSKRSSLPVAVSWEDAQGNLSAVMTENISAIGCFIPLDEEGQLNPGDEIKINVPMDFNGRVEILHLTGHVVRTRSGGEGVPGAGIRFAYSDENWRMKEKLDEFLRLRFFPRFKVDNAVTAAVEKVKGDSMEITGKLYNISRHGLYIESTDDLEMYESLDMKISTPYGSIRLEGAVCWTNPQGTNNKGKGFGVVIRRVRNKIRFLFWIWRLSFFAPIVR